MPGTTNLVADDQPIGERRMIMAAIGADDENIRAPANHDRLLAGDMARQNGPIGKIGGGDAQRKIGSG